MKREIWVFTILVTILTGCTKDHALLSNCGTCPVISFKTDVIPIFAQNCATSGCHLGQFPAGNISLDSASAYTQATKPGTGYIHAGSPSTSILLEQLYPEGMPHMPLTGQLNDCDIQKISCWIQQGAANN